MNKEFKVIDFMSDGKNVRILKVQNLSDLKYYSIKTFIEQKITYNILIMKSIY